MTSKENPRQRRIAQAADVIHEPGKVIKDDIDAKSETIRIKKQSTATPDYESRESGRTFPTIRASSSKQQDDKGNIMTDAKKIKPRLSESPTLDKKPKRSESQVNALTTQITNRNREKTRPRDDDEDWDPNDIPCMSIPRSKRELVTVTPPPRRPMDARAITARHTSAAPSQQRMILEVVITPRRSPIHRLSIAPPSPSRSSSRTPSGIEPSGSNINAEPVVVKMEDEDDDVQILGMLINPNVKVEKIEDITLDAASLKTRLGPVPFYPVGLGTQNTAFPRPFLSSIYGGSSQDPVPRISKNISARTKLQRFIYLNKMFHPYAPEKAGAPGLYFSESADEELHGKAIVFTRFQAGHWCYMGFYETWRAQALTKEEWGYQAQEVQNSWADKICKKSWGHDIRARILLRKRLGREPDEDEVEDVVARKQFTSISIDDVKKAYLDGDEVISVWGLKCIGYNAAFQVNLIEKWQGGPKRKADEIEDITASDSEQARPSKKNKRTSDSSPQTRRSDSNDKSGEGVNRPKARGPRRQARSVSPAF